MDFARVLRKIYGCFEINKKKKKGFCRLFIDGIPSI